MSPLELATAAFIDDPFYRWLFPSQREALTRAVMRLALRRCEVHASEAGLVAWHAPDTVVRPALADLGPALRLARAVSCWRRLWLGGRLLKALSRARPPGPHLHVEVLAVDAAQRGRGHARTLMELAVARAERAGWPLALETTNPRNVPLYERLGFRVTAEVTLAGIPPAWSLER